MKKMIFVTIVLILGVISNNVFAQKKDTKTVCFKSSMHCEGCQSTLTEHLKFEKGVTDLKIDYVTNTVLIEYKEGKNTEDKLAKAIEKKGYSANKISEEEYKKLVSETKKE
ncbi:MAG: heavy-metal-associated domain-containing protein [Prolixibacteraceae bacterium]|nr:heavy-metal-associated domain-containing protein [Prolixibacteraceae bacterium]MBN2774309.1 heavy-metal-associated domain-containing protein [Prolixibacteraceae bacterium]